MQSKGRYDKIKRPKGEKHGRSKLTNEQVFSLRQDRKSGMVYRELSQKYNISIASAQRIAIGKDWKHI